MLTRPFFIAQTASLCSQSTATINSQADATQYASCSTIDGSVLIGPSAAGVISLDGPEQITGDFICHDAGALTSLGSTTLGSVGGAFDLYNLTLLSTFSFNDLTSVKNISWVSLPALSSLTLPAVISEATYVLITNTFLSTLDGINLATAAILNINNNNRLKEFSTQVANVSSSINIDSNGKSLDVSFPNLIWAANLTLRNVSSVSIPSLASINGSLGFYENYFTEVNAPNLTSVGSTGSRTGSLAFVANPSLSNITIPGLKTVGGAFQIANNSALDAISFNTLSTVGGAIDFTGNFSTYVFNQPLLSSLRTDLSPVSLSPVLPLSPVVPTSKAHRTLARAATLSRATTPSRERMFAKAALPIPPASAPALLPVQAPPPQAPRRAQLVPLVSVRRLQLSVWSEL
jgi:hypothetical protein